MISDGFLLLVARRQRRASRSPRPDSAAGRSAATSALAARPAAAPQGSASGGSGSCGSGSCALGSHPGTWVPWQQRCRARQRLVFWRLTAGRRVARKRNEGAADAWMREHVRSTFAVTERESCVT